jgi:hypothetical protein
MLQGGGTVSTVPLFSPDPPSRQDKVETLSSPTTFLPLSSAAKPLKLLVNLGSGHNFDTMMV